MYDGPHSRTHAWERLWGATRVPMRALLLGILLLGVRAEAVAEATLEDGYHAMYNLQFEDAHRIFGQWQETQPDDPFAHVSDAAAYLFSEFDRLHIQEMEFFLDDRVWDKERDEEPALKEKFEQALTKGEEIAEAVLARSPDDKSALFAMAMAQGLRSDYMGLVELGSIFGYRVLWPRKGVEGGSQICGKVAGNRPHLWGRLPGHRYRKLPVESKTDAGTLAAASLWV